MNDLDFLVFAGLFKEACLKCFGHPLQAPLTETESKLFYNQVFDQTGLTIGWKSLKNYSFFVVMAPTGKEENPSVASLDTLARYVLNAPYTTETDRKQKEGHYPYWYRYREQAIRSVTEAGAPGVGALGQSARGEDGNAGNGPAQDMPAGGRARVRKTRIVAFPGAAVVLLAILAVYIFRSGATGDFMEDFHSVREDTLSARGWVVKAKDQAYWDRRGEAPGYLTLFTLKGDNWPDPVQTPVIRNLLVRKIPCDCFTMELHLKDFIPRQNWQQAGILLTEDTAFPGKSIRITIAYNDFTGGYPRVRSVLIQAITSLGQDYGKPEEIAHIPLYNVDSLDSSPALAANLDNSALRIEKQGRRFRFLYANSIIENSPFKEMASHEFSMNPKWVGLFAIKGFVDSSAAVPVRFRYFSLHCDKCAPGEP